MSFSAIKGVLLLSLALLTLCSCLHQVAAAKFSAFALNSAGLETHPLINFDANTTVAAHVDPTMPYFESAWSIMSVQCGLIAILSFSVMAVLGQWSNLGLVALVVSVAGCTANGLCFYAYYSEYSLVEVQVSAAFADVFWGIQEIGLSFYSMIILVRVLQNKQLLVYKIIFWSLFTVAQAARWAILAHRQIYLTSDPSASRQQTINNTHSLYFSAIAAMELVNGYFLISSFRPTKSAVQNSTELFRSIARSSEVRLAFLFCTGFGRAVCYSYQSTAQSAGNGAGQWDRFFAVVEGFYPTVFLIDLMAAKIASYGRGDRFSVTHNPSMNPSSIPDAKPLPSASVGKSAMSTVVQSPTATRRGSVDFKQHQQATPQQRHSHSDKVQPGAHGVELSNIVVETPGSPSIVLTDNRRSPTTPARAPIAFHFAGDTKPELVAAIISLVRAQEAANATGSTTNVEAHV